MNKLINLNFLIDDKYQFDFEKEFNQIFNLFLKTNQINSNFFVDILITNNQKIKQISKNTRNIDKETDVLSFPLVTNFIDFKTDLFLPLGEIILSYEKIEKQAEKFNHSLKREFCYLFAHSLHHLIGLDHKDKSTEQDFNTRVYQIMKKLAIFRC